MAYKEILVYLDPFSDTDVRVKFAVDLAALHGARLIGVDVCSDAAFEGDWRDRALGLQDMFEEAIKLAGIKGAYRGTYQSAKGGQHHYAHYADLIIAPQPEFEARDLIIAGIPEDVLIARVTGVIGAAIAEHAPDLVVVACNTASTMALAELRAKFSVPFVGTVPGTDTYTDQLW